MTSSLKKRNDCIAVAFLKVKWGGVEVRGGVQILSMLTTGRT